MANASARPRRVQRRRGRAAAKEPARLHGVTLDGAQAKIRTGFTGADERAARLFVSRVEVEGAESSTSPASTPTAQARSQSYSREEGRTRPERSERVEPPRSSNSIVNSRVRLVAKAYGLEKPLFFEYGVSPGVPRWGSASRRHRLVVSLGVRGCADFAIRRRHHREQAASSHTSRHGLRPTGVTQRTPPTNRLAPVAAILIDIDGRYCTSPTSRFPEPPAPSAACARAVTVSAS